MIYWKLEMEYGRLGMLRDKVLEEILQNFEVNPGDMSEDLGRVNRCENGITLKTSLFSISSLHRSGTRQQ